MLASIQSTWAQVTARPRWILLAAWLVCVAYAFPGYMNWDSTDQLIQVRNGHLSDWFPPIMAAYWKVLELVVHGPLLMLVLQTSLFLWGLYQLLRRRFADRRAAVIAALVFLSPPVLAPMAVVWKDSQMAGFLVAGLALALGEWRAHRALGVLLLVLGTGVRDNAVAVLPPLCLLIIGAWRPGRRWWSTTAVAIGLFLGIAGSATLANRALTIDHQYPWYRSVAVHDIAGTICNAGPMSDDELRDVLAGTSLRPTHDIQAAICAAYNPRVWFALEHGDIRVFEDPPQKADRLARRAAWWRLLSEHPTAWLRHRWAVMSRLLGLTDEEVWEPVAQTFGATPEKLAQVDHLASLSGFQRAVGAALVWLGQTVLFKAWVYVLLALLLLGDAIRRRDALIASWVGSGLLYEASFFVGAAAPDYRYSHWLVTLTLLAAIAAFAQRWRAGVARRATATAGVV